MDGGSGGTGIKLPTETNAASVRRMAANSAAHEVTSSSAHGPRRGRNENKKRDYYANDVGKSGIGLARNNNAVGESVGSLVGLTATRDKHRNMVRQDLVASSGVDELGLPGFDDNIGSLGNKISTQLPIARDKKDDGDDASFNYNESDPCGIVISNVSIYLNNLTFSRGSSGIRFIFDPSIVLAPIGFYNASARGSKSNNGGSSSDGALNPPNPSTSSPPPQSTTNNSKDHCLVPKNAVAFVNFSIFVSNIRIVGPPSNFSASSYKLNQEARQRTAWERNLLLSEEEAEGSGGEHNTDIQIPINTSDVLASTDASILSGFGPVSSPISFVFEPSASYAAMPSLHHPNVRVQQALFGEKKR